jgi:hypothetical protein
MKAKDEIMVKSYEVLREYEYPQGKKGLFSRNKIKCCS